MIAPEVFQRSMPKIKKRKKRKVKERNTLVMKKLRRKIK